MKFRIISILVCFALLITACNLPTGNASPTDTQVPPTAPPPPPATDTPVPPTDTPPPIDTSGWLTYTNNPYGFSLQYPPEGSLAETDTRTARIDLPFTAGTNLVEKWLDINVTTPAPTTCSSPHTAGYDPSVVTVTNYTVNGLVFRKESADGVAAGNIYEFTGYSIVHSGACISLTFVLHSTNPGNYETPPPEFDKPAESAIFEVIVGTFALFPPVAPAWLTYNNIPYNFSLMYPPDGTLAEYSPESARIDFTITPGTNLIEKYLRISVITTGAQTCTSPLGVGFEPLDIATETVTINGMEFLKESASDAGAGNIYEWVAYSINRNCVCISLGFVLHSSNPAMSDPPPPLFDKAAESAIFEAVVATLVPPPGSPTVMPGQDTSGWHRYFNGTHSFQVRYSWDSAFTDYGPNHAAIFLPFLPGTNLREKYAHINISTGTTPATCKSPHIPILVSTTNVTRNCTEFKKEVGEEGAAGNYYNIIAYSTRRADGTCVSLSFILHSVNRYNYDPPLPEFNMAVEMEIIELVVNTFRWVVP